MLSTKQRGNITEIECMLAFLKLGYNILTPYGDCERYDFVVDLQGKLYKIQVKTANENHVQDGYIEFKTANKTTRNGTFINHPYTKEEIDYFMTGYEGQYYLIPVEEVCRSNVKRLRLRPPKNGQVVGITFAEDYELQRMVNKILSQ